MAVRDGGDAVHQMFCTSGQTSWFTFYRMHFRRLVYVMSKSAQPLLLYVPTGFPVKQLERLAADHEALAKKGSRLRRMRLTHGNEEIRGSRSPALSRSTDLRLQSEMVKLGLGCEKLPNCKYPLMLSASATVGDQLCDGAVLMVRVLAPEFDQPDWEPTLL